MNSIQSWSATWPRIWLELTSFARPRCEIRHRLQCIWTLYTIYSLCSVVFHALTLKLHIQTSVAPEHPVSLSSNEKCPNFRKTSTPPLCILIIFVAKVLSVKDSFLSVSRQKAFITIVVDDIVTHGVIAELLARVMQLEEKNNKLEASFRQFNETVNEQKSKHWIN